MNVERMSGILGLRLIGVLLVTRQLGSASRKMWKAGPGSDGA